MNTFLLLVYLVGSVVALLSWYKLTTPFRLAALFIVVTFLFDLMARYIRFEFHYNMWVYHIYNLLLIPIFYFIFRLMLNLKGWRTWLEVVFFSLFTWAILNSLFFQSIWEMPSYVVIPFNLMVIFCSLLVLRKMLDEPIQIHLLKQSQFWFCTAVLLYQSCSFFYWTIYNFLGGESSMLLLKLNLAMCILYYTTLTYSVWLNKKENMTANAR